MSEGWATKRGKQYAMETPTRSQLESQLTASQAEVERLRLALKKIKHELGYVRLTCSCVNWMGGCKEEIGCSYGAVRAAKRILDTALTPAKPAEECWICRKPKGQPPDRCSGHYMGTPTDPFVKPAEEHPDTRRLDYIQSNFMRCGYAYNNKWLVCRRFEEAVASHDTSLREAIDAAMAASERKEPKP